MSRISKKNYKEYIASSAWRAKRQEYIDHPLYPNYCVGCHTDYSKGFHVHHATYERLGNEALDDLRMLCPECHTAVHQWQRKDNLDLIFTTNNIRKYLLGKKIRGYSYKLKKMML